MSSGPPVNRAFLLVGGGKALCWRVVDLVAQSDIVMVTIYRPPPPLSCSLSLLLVLVYTSSEVGTNNSKKMSTF